MRIARRPVTDELLIDSELVVLVGDQVLVLSEVASTALHGLVTEVWTTVDELTDRLEASVGLPDEGRPAVLSLIEALADAGLVDVEP